MTESTADAPKAYCEISCGRCILKRECPEFYLAAAAAPESCPLDTCPAPTATPPSSPVASPPAGAPYVQYTLPNPDEVRGFRSRPGTPPNTPTVQYNLPG